MGYYLHIVTDVALFTHDMSVAQETPWVRLSQKGELIQIMVMEAGRPALSNFGF